MALRNQSKKRKKSVRDRIKDKKTARHEKQVFKRNTPFMSAAKKPLNGETLTSCLPRYST